MSNEADPPRKSPPPPDVKKTPPPPSVNPSPSTPPKPEAETKPAVAPLKVSTVPDRDEEDTFPPVDKGSGIPLKTRVMAMLIDFAIGVGLYLGVIIFAKMTTEYFSYFASPLFLAFLLTRDGLPFLKGQSPGKSAMKIKAVTLKGESLAGNWQPVIVRNIVLLVPLFAIVELVVLLTREDKSDHGIRLGDEWAKTRVVKADPPEPIEQP